MPNDYLAFLLVFIALVGVACLPWDALDEVARSLPQRSPHENE